MRDGGGIAHVATQLQRELGERSTRESFSTQLRERLLNFYSANQSLSEREKLLSLLLASIRERKQMQFSSEYYNFFLGLLKYTNGHAA